MRVHERNRDLATMLCATAKEYEATMVIVNTTYASMNLAGCGHGWSEEREGVRA
jgi:hypothetical protein